jgi:hypothetical protein
MPTSDDDILRTVATGARRIDEGAIRLLFRRLRDLVDKAQDLLARVVTLEQQQNRALAVDVLPDNAPLGALIRLRGDATGALYLGNGPTRPLTKLLPGPL